jgi:hypothetical protein
LVFRVSLVVRVNLWFDFFFFVKRVKQAAAKCGFCVTSIEFQSLQLDGKTEKQLEQRQTRSMLALNEITSKQNNFCLQELNVEAKEKNLEF